jgi:hypothetical protein
MRTGNLGDRPLGDEASAFGRVGPCLSTEDPVRLPRRRGTPAPPQPARHAPPRLSGPLPTRDRDLVVLSVVPALVLALVLALVRPVVLALVRPVVLALVPALVESRG